MMGYAVAHDIIHPHLTTNQQAQKELQDAVIKALDDPLLSSDDRTALENAIDPTWGPADMVCPKTRRRHTHTTPLPAQDGMDPMAKKALQEGKAAALVGAALAAGTLPASAAKGLAAPHQKVTDANAKVADVARAGANEEAMPNKEREVLKAAVGAAPPAGGGADFGPADLGGMDPVGQQRAAPGLGNDFGPADLTGMTPVGALFAAKGLVCETACDVTCTVLTFNAHLLYRTTASRRRLTTARRRLRSSR